MNLQSSVSTTTSITYISLPAKVCCMYVQKVGRLNMITDVQVLQNTDTKNLSNYYSLAEKSSPEPKL